MFNGTFIEGPRGSEDVQVWCAEVQSCNGGEQVQRYRDAEVHRCRDAGVVCSGVDIKMLKRDRGGAEEVQVQGVQGVQGVQVQVQRCRGEG